jgi:phosphoesterase RecJ-like protein
MDRIIGQLKRSERVLVASHANPDGDAIGSLLAMGCALQAAGKTVAMYNESPIPAVYRFLPAIGAIRRRLPPEGACDTAVILDCGDLSRVGDAADAIGRIPCLISIDHHLTNRGFGDLQWLDPSACATAEIVHRLIGALGVPLNPCMAAALYTGILTDTGSFRFSNTNQAAFRICGEMVAAGVDPYRVAQHVYGTYSMGRIKLLNLALDSIEISADGKVSFMTLTRAMLAETNTHPEDVDGLINYARRIQDVRLAVLIQERINGQRSQADPQPYHVSLRSDGSLDVAAIAVAFGGGGHASAAGFNADLAPERIKARILELACSGLQTGCSAA